MFTKALEYKKNDWGIMVNRGDCHYKLKNIEDALKDYLSSYEIAGK
jgi:tetratricopeptide (TPR) repeat protein